MWSTLNVMALSAVDLFAGCGGFSVGLVDAGIDVLGAVDCDVAALDTYRRNVADHVKLLDLSDTDAAIELLEGVGPDLVVGSPPCQDFSTAGNGVEGEQANLTAVFGRIVCGYRPEAFLMENVPRVRNSYAYQQMRRMVTDAEYSLVELTLNASRFGVPQTRRRFFVFGYRHNHNTAGSKFAAGVETRQTPHDLTVKEYLGDEIDVEFYYRHPTNYSRRSVFTVHEPSPTIRRVNRPVPPNYVGNHLDSAPPNTVRPLTTQQRSRIQTFPQGWEWKGSNRNAASELQIGNAVPPRLATHLGTAIREALNA